MEIRIDRINLYELRMALVSPFETSFGRTEERRILLVEAVSEGISGWGEATCGEHPYYNEEWTGSAWLLLANYLAPAVVGRSFATPSEVAELSSRIRGHRMTRAAMEDAVWDLAARLEGVPLWKKIGGGARREIPCGVSIGIQESPAALLRRIEQELLSGYQRIKIKIRPGWDIDVLRQVRREFPSVPLMADANSAYTLADAEHLKRLDEFGLMMLEQPLAHDDILDHAALQRRLETPICLDESVRHARAAEQAIQAGACRILNIKLGRVGGFTEAKRVHDVALACGVPVWCGGMLESGVGRSHNVALATLPGFTLPGDVSASHRYWARDVIQPGVAVTPQGTILVPGQAGSGWEVDRAFIESITARKETFA